MIKRRKKSLDFAFIDESKILTFQKEIENYRDHCDTWVEAIVSYCEEYEIDVDEIVHLISDGLKAKMHEEAVSSNAIKSEPMLPF